MSVPFRYVGQSALIFDFGKLEPDDEFEITPDRLEAFRYRGDMECLDSEAVAEIDAANAPAPEPTPEPVVAPEIVTPIKSNAKSADSGKSASIQE